MIRSNPLSKRIKRQVIGRVHTFFIATAPGLNRVCHDELSSLSLPITDVAVLPGGVEFKGRLEDCYRANLLLRTANRVLMRLAGIKATNFRQLNKKTIEFPWELYLTSHENLELNISVSGCRLYHTAALRDCVLTGIADRMGSFNRHSLGNDIKSPPQKLFLRGNDDRFSLSLDSSGDLLYKRGIKRHGGLAPVRETLAAAALSLAGYTGQEPLIDPMCGSGTFSLEAGMLAAHIPPGWYRKFSFMDWPSFKPKQWEYIQLKAKKNVAVGSEPMIFASDLDTNALNALAKTVQSMGLTKTIRVVQKDFFDFKPSDITLTNGLVVINPPYGIRLKTGEVKEGLLGAIIRKLISDYENWRFVLIAPEKRFVKRLPFQHSVYPVFHGGLSVNLVVGKI